MPLNRREQVFDYRSTQAVGSAKPRSSPPVGLTMTTTEIANYAFNEIDKARAELSPAGRS